jgi:hypothetical protein
MYILAFEEYRGHVLGYKIGREIYFRDLRYSQQW